MEIESALRCKLVAGSAAVKCFLTGKVEYSLDSRGFNQILQLTLLNHQLCFDYIIALTTTVNQIFKLLRVAQHIRFTTRWLDRSGKLGNVRIRTWLEISAKHNSCTTLAVFLVIIIFVLLTVIFRFVLQLSMHPVTTATQHQILICSKTYILRFESI